MFKRSLLACSLLLGSSAVLLAADGDVDSADKKFVEKAASGGLLEVQLGEYAAANAGAQNVKDFGTEMVTDHKKVNEELRAIAKSKNIEPSGVLRTKDQKTLEKLEKYKGTEFDKEYIDGMVDDHEADIKAFEKEAKDGSDADLKAFAEKALPTLKHHLMMAKDIKSKQ